MEKYLIVLDLDNTLLHSDKSISDNSKAILEKCQKLGCKIVVNTARSYIRTIDFAKQINADYICSFNGNFVCDKYDNIIYYNHIPENNSRAVIEEISKYTKHIVNEGLYASFCIDKEDVNFVDSKFASLNFVKNLQSCKLILKCKNEEYTSIKSITENYNLSITFMSEKNTARILPKDTDKWTGIQKIKQHLNQKYKVIAFGDDITDLETLSNADIGVRMKNSTSELIEKINFSTSSNNDDGVARFLCHYFNLEQKSINYDNVKILDCSLRDGGHLNESKFGYDIIKGFIEKLALARTDIIEIGFLQDCNFDKDCAIYPTVEDAEKILQSIDCKNSIISLLTQVDKFDISRLKKCSGKVKMIRVSFHSNYIDLGMQYCEEVKKKGYICSVNPINFSHYSNEQVVELIAKVNKINPDIFSIVDTFGVLLNKDFRNKLNLINHLLNQKISRGIHLHENLNLAFSSAQTLIDTNSFDGDIVIDTSVEGMGRAPGNLKTEFLEYYINNSTQTSRYEMEYIYALMENEIEKLKGTLNWKNNFAYGISAFEKVHRTYAEYLLKKGLSLKEIERLIKLIPVEKKGGFDDKIIETIYQKH